MSEAGPTARAPIEQVEQVIGRAPIEQVERTIRTARLRAPNIEFPQRIMTGLIVDDHFARTVLPLLKRHHLQIAHGDTIIRWVREYVEKYDMAPKQQIQEIFKLNSKKLSPEDADSIKQFLSWLSTQFEKEKTANWKFYLDQVLDFIHLKDLEELQRQLVLAQQLGDVVQADKLIQEFRMLRKDRKRSTHTSFFDPKRNKDALNPNTASFFQPGGALGLLLGMLQPEWLVAVMGAFKRGKSNALIHLACEAVMQGLRVLYISLEMNEDEVRRRVIAWFTKRPWTEKPYIYSVFDCRSNQDLSCKLPMRTNVFYASGDPDRPPDRNDFDPNNKYRACTACRNHTDSAIRRNYKPATWFKQEQNNETIMDVGVDYVQSLVDGAVVHGADSLQIMPYVMNSVSAEDVMQDIVDLTREQGSAPNIIIIDYADLLRPPADVRGKDNRHGLDAIWKGLKAMAQELHVLVLTATQTNRLALNVRNTGESHVAEDIRKLAHVNMFFTVHQTVDGPDSDRDMLRVRFRKLLDRNASVTSDEVIATQSPSTGQFILDSVIVSAESNPNLNRATRSRPNGTSSGNRATVSSESDASSGTRTTRRPRGDSTLTLGDR